MKPWPILCVPLLLAGCGKPAPPATPAAARPAAPTNAATAEPESFGSGVVDVLTQRRTVQAGRQAKAAIEAASAKEQKDLEAVMNE